MRKLIIVGAGEFGELAYEYFSDDSEYEVVAFAVEKKYKKSDTVFDLPVIDFERIEQLYSPLNYDVFIAVTFVRLNRERARLYKMCKEKGYHCASYINSSAFVGKHVEIGENVFVFENSTLQHYVSLGNNVIVWSGAYIGHRTVVEENCWLAPHMAAGGFCRIGQGSFVGINATLGDNVTIEKDIVLGAGAVTVKSLTDAGQVYIGSPAKKLGRTSYEQFDVNNDTQE